MDRVPPRPLPGRHSERQSGRTREGALTPATPKVGAILLAAGRSTRFGRPKQLEPIDGVPMALGVARTLAASQLDELVAVLGPASAGLRSALEVMGVRVTLNPRPEDGLSSSLRRGLTGLSTECDGALFVPADLPRLTSTTVDRLLREFRSAHGPPSPIVVPTSRGHRRAPALFPSDLFPELASLTGDVGGRALFESRAARIVEVEVVEGEELRDVDRPRDLAEPPSEVP